jgi:hypothetical protein
VFCFLPDLSIARFGCSWGWQICLPRALRSEMPEWMQHLVRIVGLIFGFLATIVPCHLIVEFAVTGQSAPVQSLGATAIKYLDHA